MPLSFGLQFFPASGSFPISRALHIWWPKYLSFSNSPSNEYSELISLRIDWFDLLAVQGTLKESSPAPQFESINSFVFSLPYGPTLTSIYDYWKNHSFDYMDLCWQSDVSAVLVGQSFSSKEQAAFNFTIHGDIWVQETKICHRLGDYTGERATCLPLPSSKQNSPAHCPSAHHTHLTTV